MTKFYTAYTLTKQCCTPDAVISKLQGVGLGRAVIADECRKIAAANGPKASIYRSAAEKALTGECDYGRN